MSRKAELKGKKFGRLYVLESAGSDSRGNQLWSCECECGNIITAKGYNLTGGVTHSCGCFKKEQLKKSITKHGHYYTRLRNVWNTMLQRCSNENTKAYKWYGARGIKVCAEWKNSFPAFREWALANGYDETAKRGDCTIDRINVDGDYEPSNCRWTTMAEQQRNRRNNRKG